MTTRRQFIKNFALAGIGIPVVQVASPFESLASSAYINPQYMEEMSVLFLGMTETPIRDGESVKDLQQSETVILRKEDQPNGGVIICRGECFIKGERENPIL